MLFYFFPIKFYLRFKVLNLGIVFYSFCYAAITEKEQHHHQHQKDNNLIGGESQNSFQSELLHFFSHHDGVTSFVIYRYKNNSFFPFLRTIAQKYQKISNPPCRQIEEIKVSLHCVVGKNVLAHANNYEESFFDHAFGGSGYLFIIPLYQLTGRKKSIHRRIYPHIIRC